MPAARRFFSPRQPKPRPMLDLAMPSLMSPYGGAQPSPAGGLWEQDIGLSDLVRAFTTDNRYAPYIRAVLATLNTDPLVIAWRAAVLADFVNNPALVEQAETTLPLLADLRQGNPLLGGRSRGLLLETADRLAELDQFITIVTDLHRVLAASALESPALRQIRDQLGALLADDNFRELRDNLPQLSEPLSNITSLTVGINLDAQLKPASALLLAVNDFRLGESVSLLERLIGGRSGAEDDTPLAALHHVPKDADQRILSPLFQDLDRLLTQVAKPVADALKRYVKTGSGPLVALEHQLAFYVGAVNMMRRAGVSFCRPEIAPMAERINQIDELVNIALVLRGEPALPNDVDLGAEGAIAILTGPNSGGKTTYVRSLGLAQVLFQAGLMIPAARARLSPVDAILTHFPTIETRQQGRLAEEAERLREIFAAVTAHSLVLLNETFSSTASGEALYLAQDMLCGLRAVGARAVYATHLVELAERIPDMEAAVEGASRLCSLVAGVELDESGAAHPTYRITRGLPQGRSYAQEIARRHGISLAQILAARRK